MAELNARGTTVSDEGAVFTPWGNDEGAIGFKVTAKGKPDRYVYLNPSLATDTGDIEDSDVFVYHGDTGYPDLDEPQCYVNIWPSEFLTAQEKAVAEEARQDAEYKLKREE